MKLPFICRKEKKVCAIGINNEKGIAVGDITAIPFLCHVKYVDVLIWKVLIDIRPFVSREPDFRVN